MNNKMLEESVKYINELDNVSFVELLRHLENKGFNVRGECAILLNENLVVWVGMSQEFIDIFQELRNSCPIIACNKIIYLMDGASLPIKPINAKSIKNNYKYKSERWIPVVFRKKQDINKKNALFVYN